MSMMMAVDVEHLQIIVRHRLTCALKVTSVYAHSLVSHPSVMFNPDTH